MSDGEMKLQELDATIAGQKLKLTGANLNTLFTVLGFILSCLIAWVLWQHQTSAASKDDVFVSALKDVATAQRETTTVQREMNCLISIPEAQREAKAEFCKRVTR